MNLHTCDELAPLHDSVTRLLAEEAGFADRRAAVTSGAGWNPRLWSHLVELGVTSLCAPEAAGGFGRSAADLGDLHRLYGRALLLEPVLATALSTHALSAAAAPPTLFDGIVQGRLTAWAHDEDGAHHAPLWVACRAQQQDGVWHLHGRKRHVLHGADAQHLIVTARVHGAAGDSDGLSLFLLDPTVAGVQRRVYHLLDDTPAAELVLDGAVATPLCAATIGHDASAIHATLRLGIALTCADMVGAMETAHALTLDHVQTREQFGRPLAANQALRHRVADMVVQIESARSMAMLAAAAVDHGLDPSDLSRAKLVVGRAARSVCHSAVQLHGGIGMSEEHAVGHCLRRVLVADQLFGDATAHAAQLGHTLAKGVHA